MQPLEYLLIFLITEIGIETTFQVVYEAVSQDTLSEQADQLYSAFRVVIEHLNNDTCYNDDMA